MQLAYLPRRQQLQVSGSVLEVVRPLGSAGGHLNRSSDLLLSLSLVAGTGADAIAVALHGAALPAALAVSHIGNGEWFGTGVQVLQYIP